MKHVTFAPTVADTQDYLSAMAQHVTSVCVVTTELGGRFHGLTATAVASVCAAPPRLLVCVNAGSDSHDCILASGHFCVNILAETHQHIARRFGGMDPAGGDKFGDGDWVAMPSGAPRLADALAAFDCRIAETARHHTHTVIFGDVMHVETTGPRDALLYGARRFRRAAT